MKRSLLNSQVYEGKNTTSYHWFLGRMPGSSVTACMTDSWQEEGRNRSNLARQEARGSGASLAFCRTLLSWVLSAAQWELSESLSKASWSHYHLLGPASQRFQCLVATVGTKLPTQGTLRYISKLTTSKLCLSFKQLHKKWSYFRQIFKNKIT